MSQGAASRMSAELRPFGWWLEAALGQMSLNLLEQRVFLFLYNLAEGAESCWPSVRTLCEKLGRSERPVQKALTRLENLGMISTGHRSGGRGVTTEWFFPLGWWFRFRGELEAAEKAEAREQSREALQRSAQEDKPWRERADWESEVRHRRRGSRRRKRQPTPEAVLDRAAEESTSTDRSPRSEKPVESLPESAIRAIWQAAWGSSAVSVQLKKPEYDWPAERPVTLDRKRHRQALVELRELACGSESLVRAAFDRYLEAERHRPLRGQHAGSPWGVYPFVDPPSLPKFARETRRWLDEGRQHKAVEDVSVVEEKLPSNWVALPRSIQAQVLTYLGAAQLTPTILQALKCPGYLEDLLDQLSC
jgi:DNA-binding transcriptional regulator YhcF (GntR family)